MVSSKYAQMWVVFSLKDEIWTLINYSFNETGLNIQFQKTQFFRQVIDTKELIRDYLVYSSDLCIKRDWDFLNSVNNFVLQIFHSYRLNVHGGGFHLTGIRNNAFN